jgi:MoaA/NifB/PqqE/SkfB family radical SAM enzyme
MAPALRADERGRERRVMTIGTGVANPEGAAGGLLPAAQPSVGEHDAVAPNTLTSAFDELDKVTSHEEAAHEKRNWVRLSYDCNNHCTFCLDTLAHNGTMRGNLDIKVQIVEGRKKGATRLILSGGEPTMHPNFLDFVKLGRRAGYRRIQTVTNGRMFAYPEFLESAAENGLHEITFSVHGHTAKLHDALVGTPGAFVQETAGLKAALASGRFIVNVDIVINKQNVKHLPEMLETFIGWGVKEFDLLHIIPFGNAWGTAREHLFYDLEGNEEALRRAFAYSRRPDVHVWLNRFPPPYAEGFEELIQDPYKMNDEVRGRREEYDRYLSIGEKLHCREPARCRYCYLEQLCDTLDLALDERKAPAVDVLRIAEPAPIAGTLPMARVARVVAGDLAEARRLVQRANPEAIWLELPSYEELASALGAGDELFGKRLERCYASTGAEVERLLGIGAFTVAAWVTKSTVAVIERLAPFPERLMLAQPNYDRVTDNRAHDVDLKKFFERIPVHVKTENIPACLSGREPERVSNTLDAGMLGTDARIDMGKYAQRYIADRYYTKSRRCSGCVHTTSCSGVHINFIRAHGYAPLVPVVAPGKGA